MSTKTARKRKPVSRARNKQPVVVEKVEAVYGVYPNQLQTANAVRALKHAGVRTHDISASPLLPAEEQLRKADAQDTRTDPAVEDVFDATARITGCVMGLGAVALAAPFAIAVPVLGALGMTFGAAANSLGQGMPVTEPAYETDREMLVRVDCHSPAAAERVARALKGSGGKDVGISGQYEFAHSDLNRRKYHDELGNVHHHTHTYMRDHAGRIHGSAA